MFSKIIKFLRCLPDLKLLCSFKYSGILWDYGWWRSYKKKLPVDKEGNPLPWVTYPFIEFITPRLRKEYTMFEYGGGSSTFFFSKYVNEIFTVESDKEWYKKLKSKCQLNVTPIYKKLIRDGEYAKMAVDTGKKFDIISVDGRDRANCIKNALSALKDEGVIILDDSEREEYKESVDFLRSHSFRSIDFWGFSPGLFYRKCTSILYKDKNCLGI